MEGDYWLPLKWTKCSSVCFESHRGEWVLQVRPVDDRVCLLLWEYYDMYSASLYAHLAQGTHAVMCFGKSETFAGHFEV